MWALGRNAPLIRFLMSALYYCLLVCIMYHHKHQACKLNKEDAVDRCKWRKVIKEVRWPGWVWAGECFLWYRPTRVVLDKRPLNGCWWSCCCLYHMLPRLSFFSLFPYLSFPSRIDPLHFQVGCRKRRLNLALVFLVFFVCLFTFLCFTCVCVIFCVCLFML